jgi:hypothetical protein
LPVSPIRGRRPCALQCMNTGSLRKKNASYSEVLAITPTCVHAGTLKPSTKAPSGSGLDKTPRCSRWTSNRLVFVRGAYHLLLSNKTYIKCVKGQSGGEPHVHVSLCSTGTDYVDYIVDRRDVAAGRRRIVVHVPSHVGTQLWFVVQELRQKYQVFPEFHEIEIVFSQQQLLCKPFSSFHPNFSAPCVVR